MGWHDDGDARGRHLSWIDATGELYLTLGGGSIEVLAVEPNERLLDAVIRGRPEGECRISWLKRTLAERPRPPRDVEKAISEFESVEHERATALVAARRASFRVAALAELPPARPYRDLARCSDCEWASVAAVAVDAFVAGLDPLDSDAAYDRGLEELPERDVTWFLSLFNDPSTVAGSSSSAGWVNGQHRVEAMRRAGVERCVISWET